MAILRGKHRKKEKRKKIGIDDIKNNIIRRVSHWVYKTFHFEAISNHYFLMLHCIFISFVSIVFIFCTNVYYLVILLFIITMDAFSVVVFHKCPLTILEEKYLGTNTSDERRHNMEKCGIVYNCDHEYEKQIELLINVWSLIAVKCLGIIGLKTFDFKIIDFHNTYIHNSGSR